ncbi:hypothetical protein [Mariniblastus fucicola]|uniref:Uncharacterized protein n=1 Tax=Mariniblastus fucicola TaxID=980251 RepID=A0A5B9PN64_9BACT|nr:hypothetical protein [Mariniblastus fucicola]QEG23971.1 hypothetical protein MFFC18_38760 [Mariniblastus fucicola]
MLSDFNQQRLQTSHRSKVPLELEQPLERTQLEQPLLELRRRNHKVQVQELRNRKELVLRIHMEPVLARSNPRCPFCREDG